MRNSTIRNSSSLTLILGLGSLMIPANGAEILWSQYCQHLGKMKLLVHLDTDPTVVTEGDSEPVKPLASGRRGRGMETRRHSAGRPAHCHLLFVLEDWPRHEGTFKATCGNSEWEGIFRAEPKDGSVLKAVGLSCLKQIGWPWKEVAEVIAHDPDLVIFAGDQIYENDYGSPVFYAKTKEEVPQGMKNYFEKYRKFGEAFRELMRDRPTIMITDDHDVFSPDLWGNGGVLINGKRTTGGYPAHLTEVNAAEFTQTGQPRSARRRDQGVLHRPRIRRCTLCPPRRPKWKSPPSEVIKELIVPPGFDPEAITHTEIEVVLDPDYDCTQLDDPKLQLLGAEQEAFLADWSDELKASGQIGAVISASPWAHVAMYSPTSADLDSNAWPQSARNRALKAIGDKPVVMLHGDVHLGTLGRHGVDEFDDGPVTFSFPAFASPRAILETARSGPEPRTRLPRKHRSISRSLRQQGDDVWSRQRSQWLRHHSL